MDKRYLLIFIIIFICFIGLFVIANNSDNIGSASVACGKYSFRIPNGFSLYDSATYSVHISNGNPGINIVVHSMLNKNDTFKNVFNKVSNSSSLSILSNGSIDANGIKIDSVYYRNLQNNRNESQ